MNSQESRIIIYNELGNFLCGDVYLKEFGQSKLISEEVDIDELTQEIFDSKPDKTMQLWKQQEFIYLATKVYKHKRLIRIKSGLIDQFELNIIEPAKGGGQIELIIANSTYSGYIIKGDTRLSDWENFNKIAKQMELEILPRIVKLFEGQIVKVNRYCNA
ncbi:MAG: hypothetical protein IPN86_04955 [Saprospiraceae bacterium]|nr:hypothetical protein [Saprospiraceae bacterium]